MIKTHRFRLYPNKMQTEKLLDTLDLCRQTYNMLLAEFNNWDNISKYELQSIIPNLKICDPTLKKVHSKALQYENYRLFSNLAALGESKQKGRKVGRLRFKGKGWFKTVHYNQSGFKLITTGKRLNSLSLSKIGEIPVMCHRKIFGKIKQVVIKKEPTGKWFASIVEQLPDKPKQYNPEKVIGIDLGLTDIVYDSDGKNTQNPRQLKKYAERLSYLHNRVSKTKKGSNNRLKARHRLCLQYEKLTNSRDDFLHKLSHYYVKNYDVIAFENMKITNMVHGKLAKSILDSSWGKLRQFTSYKAANAGKMYVEVEYKGTTQDCSQCGARVPKEIWQREHKCDKCGFVVPRDYNSALEIKNRALIEIGMGRAESTPVEMEALSFRGQLPSEKQEATTSTIS